MQSSKLITGLMKGTVPFSKKTLSHLSGLIKEYPYFQTAHFLHTLNLLYLKDTRFTFDLRKTAIYLPDRERLFFKVEEQFFTSELMEAAEKEKIPVDSPAEIINSFLSKKNNETEIESFETKSSPVSTDYISYFLSDNDENDETPSFKHQEIIDEFLKKDAVSSIKINLKNQDELSEKHIDKDSGSTNDEGFFSETLAKIYIKQKKYNKALEIIRALNLIYPEKNRYFADQIRFLEKLIINTK